MDKKTRHPIDFRRSGFMCYALSGCRSMPWREALAICLNPVLRFDCPPGDEPGHLNTRLRQSDTNENTIQCFIEIPLEQWTRIDHANCCEATSIHGQKHATRADGSVRWRTEVRETTWKNDGVPAATFLPLLGNWQVQAPGPCPCVGGLPFSLSQCSNSAP